MGTNHSQAASVHALIHTGSDWCKVGVLERCNFMAADVRLMIGILCLEEDLRTAGYMWNDNIAPSNRGYFIRGAMVCLSPSDVLLYILQLFNESPLGVTTCFGRLFDVTPPPTPGSSAFVFADVSFLPAGVKSGLLPFCAPVDGVNGKMRNWFV